jgi:hypothetical protein
MNSRGEDDLDALLSRPLEQRIREHKVRFAQAVVFGLPVLGLYLFGESLGGPPAEARRWSAVLQALLAGWVTYVAAAGMVAEGCLLLGRRLSPDLVVAGLAVLLYLVSFVSVVGVLVRAEPFYRPLCFHLVVVILAGWCGTRWWQLRRSTAASE